MLRLTATIQTLILGGTLLSAVPLRALAEESSSSPQPRATMHQIFDALTYLLPLSFDEDRFNDPARREEIDRRLGMLAVSAGKLEKHGERRDVDFRNLSRSLSADIAEARQRMELGKTDEARYFLIELTRNCVACHSRLPKARDFPLGDKLVEQIDMEGLSNHERAQILVATRQFERALGIWEGMFEDPSVLPAEMDLGGYLVDYLTVNVRVQRNSERPRAAFAKLALRSDTPRYLKRHLKVWVSALGSTDAALKSAPTLENARDLMRRPDRSTDFPSDRKRLVYDLVASALLLQYVDRADRENTSHKDLAEAFYWLGVAESRSIDNYWVPQTEFHLEASIRLAPHGPLAEQAYDLLEEYITVGYGGVFGEEYMPVDVWARLEELRRLLGRDDALIDPAQPASPDAGTSARNLPEGP